MRIINAYGGGMGRCSCHWVAAAASTAAAGTYCLYCQETASTARKLRHVGYGVTADQKNGKVEGTYRKEAATPSQEEGVRGGTEGDR